MMKRMVLVLLVCSSSVWAYDPYGVCHVSNNTVDKVICDGPAVLVDTKVKGVIKVTGALTAANVITHAGLVSGSATLKNVTIDGLTVINGDLNANHSTFNQDLKATANHTVLSGCSVKGSIVIDINNEHAPDVKIECGSLVNGDVEFKGKQPGLVQVTDDSFLKGKVINGTMEFVRETCAKQNG